MKKENTKGGALTEIIRYGAVGFVSTVIDLGVLKLLTMFSWPYWIALALGFSSGTVNGYFMNSRWTFKYKTAGSEGIKFSQFTIVSLIGLGLTELIGNSYMSIFGADVTILGKTIGAKMIGKLISVVLVFAWNYLGNKFWTFRRAE
ncbi:MAG: GtrA family protein [Candidatus Berkelbacteria bacterium]|nr:GtrA family protein [Candidatus Berkelbacteria bacterium]